MKKFLVFSASIIGLIVLVSVSNLTLQSVSGSGLAVTPDSSEVTQANSDNNSSTSTIDAGTIRGGDYGALHEMYVSPGTGLKFTFPEGWNGTENTNQINATQIMVGGSGNIPSTGVAEMKGEPFIAVNICHLHSTPPECFSLQGKDHYSDYSTNEVLPSDPSRCKRTSFENVKVGDYDAIQVELNCPFLFDPSQEMKFKYVLFDTDSSQIIFQYSTFSPSPNYDTYLPEFDKTIQSVSFEPNPPTSTLETGDFQTDSETEIVSPETTSSSENGTIDASISLSPLPATKGQDLHFVGSAVDSSSKEPIDVGVILDGVLVSQEDANKIREATNSTGIIDWLGPTTVVPANIKSLYSFESTTISEGKSEFSLASAIEELETGTYALAVTFSAYGYDPISKIVEFEVRPAESGSTDSTGAPNIDSNNSSIQEPQSAGNITNVPGTESDTMTGNNTNTDTLPVGSGFKIHEDSASGIRVAYPPNWILETEESVTPMMKILAKITPENDPNTKFTIGLREMGVGQEIYNFSGYANSLAFAYGQLYKNFSSSLVNPNGKISSGAPAYDIEGKYLDNQSRARQFFEIGTLVDGNKIYIAQFDTEDSKAKSYLDILRAMIRSFEIMPTAASTSADESSASSSINTNNDTGPASQTSFSDTETVIQSNAGSDNTSQQFQNLGSVSEESSGSDTGSQSISDFTIYENNTSGIKITHPNDWIVQQGTMINPSLQIAVKFIPPSDADSDFVVGIRKVPNEMTTEEYAKNSLDKYKTGFENFQENEFQTNGTLGLTGSPAYKIKGSFTDAKSTERQFLEAGTVLDNNAYILQFDSEASKFSDYSPILERMIRSFLVNPPISDGGVESSQSSMATGGDEPSQSSMATGGDEPSQPTCEINPCELPTNSNDNTINGTAPPTTTTIPSSSSFTPSTEGSDLFIEVVSGSDPVLRGADQSIFVDVRDYSSRTGIDQAKVSGVMVDGSEAQDLIKNVNSTKLVDVGTLDGQRFTGVTDSNGQFSHVTRISEDLEPGLIAVVVTVDTNGYKTSSKIGTFQLE